MQAGTPTSSGKLRGLTMALLFITLPALVTFRSLSVHLSPFYYSVLFLLLTAGAGALVLLATLSSHRSPLLGILASVVSGCALAWHWRESVWPPYPRTPSFLAAGLLSLLTFTLARSQARRLSVRRAVAGLLITAVGSAGGAALLFASDGNMRWLLIRHVRSIGVPLYLLLDREAESRFVAEFSRSPSLRPMSNESIAVANRISEKSPPNLVLVLVDTLRADSVPPWSDSTAALSFFASLARESVVFGDVLSNSSWTKPAVASLFTGLMPEEHGARDREEVLADGFVTLAELLGSAGYRTGAIVSNYSVIGRRFGFAQGFDDFVELRELPYARADRVTTEAVHWLSRAEEGRPNFLYVHYLEPHDPYLSGSLPTDLRPASRLPAYRAEIRFLDRWLSRLAAALDESSSRRTVLLLVSDHGEEFGDHGGDSHGRTLYREQLHIPVFVRDRVLQPSLVDQPMELRDFFDLVLRLASGETELPQLIGGLARESRRSSLYLRSPSLPFYRPHILLAHSRRLDRAGRVLIWSGLENTFEEYDARVDPDERSNLRLGRQVLSEEALELVEPFGDGWAPTQTAEPDEGDVDQLRSLGYL